MPKLLRSVALTLLIPGFLASGITACRGPGAATSEPNPIASGGPVSSPSPSPVTVSASPAAPPSLSNFDPYDLALDRASSARSISQSAQSPDDWNLAASRWQQAIALLKRVPNSSPNRKAAKAKLAEFQRNMALANKQAARAKSDTATLGSGIQVDPVQPTSTFADMPPITVAGQRVYRARIKYRRNRIPVIDVVFNGRRSFEMMVDTGASGTMITETMARELNVDIVGEVAIGTASGKAIAPVAFVKSISAAGSTIRNVPVTIGPLEVGLLGHDFFGDCEISIKRDVVEFRRCS